MVYNCFSGFYVENFRSLGLLTRFLEGLILCGFFVISVLCRDKFRRKRLEISVFIRIGFYPNKFLIEIWNSCLGSLFENLNF